MKNWHRGIAILGLGLTFVQVAQGEDCDASYPPVIPNFYMGVNGGFATYRTERADLSGFFSSIQTPETTNTSWIAGIQFGHDWFFSHRFLGLVVDWDWTDAKTRLFYSSNLSIEQQIDSRIRWFSTIRARGGIALKDVMFYLTGGAAVADLKTEIVNDLFSSDHLFQKHRWGWTVGFGSEFPLGCQWTIYGELLYMRFQSEKVSLLTDGLDYSFKFFDDTWAGRIGINYRFSLCPP